MLESIFEEIKKEREYQDGKWGLEFDNKNTINDWIAYICQYAGKAGYIHNGAEEQRLYLLKVASLAIAALEAFDRNGKFAPRHYD